MNKGFLSSFDVVIPVFGTKGDVYPLLAIAQTMESCGASVTFLTNDFFEPEIKRLGFNFVSTGRRQDYLDYLENIDLHTDNPDVIENMWSSCLRDPYVASVRHILTMHETGKNLLIVGLWPVFNGGFAVAEHLNLPSVQISLYPSIVNSVLSPPAPAKWMQTGEPNESDRLHAIYARSIGHLTSTRSFHEMNSIRRKFAIQPLEITDHIESFFIAGRLQLMLCPKWYADPAADFPAGLKYLGFPFLGSHLFKSDHEVDRFCKANPKPVVVTAGTGIRDANHFFRTVLDALSNSNIPIIFVGGAEDIILPLERKDVLHVNSVDFSSLFKKARLIIHHGGIGTTAQAMKAGVPQFVIPRAFDQFDNADRVARLGMGSFLLEQNLTVDDLRHDIEAVLINDSLILNAAHVADRFLDEDFRVMLVRAIEEYTAEALTR
ncbi:MAG: glycosyltransferase [Litorimonas sp.]